MTRQPAAEKRFTVAWPMPRLAPVSSRARRGWLSWGVTIGILEPQYLNMAFQARSRIEPHLAPRRPGPGATELDAIVQPIGPILPEFDDQGQQPVATSLPAAGSFQPRTWPCSKR